MRASSSRSSSSAVWSGECTMTSCLPSRAGYLLGTTRASQPGVSGALPSGAERVDLGRRELLVALAEGAAGRRGGLARPAAARRAVAAARAGATMVSLPLTGLRRSSPPCLLRRRCVTPVRSPSRGERYSESSEASRTRLGVLLARAVQLARVAQLVVVLVEHGAHLAPQAHVLLEVLLALIVVRALARQQDTRSRPRYRPRSPALRARSPSSMRR